MTDEQIDASTRAAAHALLDHIDEYGTMAEGVRQRIRAVVRAALAAPAPSVELLRGAAAAATECLKIAAPAQQPCGMKHDSVWKEGAGGLPYQQSNFSCRACGYVGSHDTHPGCVMVRTAPAPAPAAPTLPEHQRSAPPVIYLHDGDDEHPPLPVPRKPDENGAGWFTAGQMRAYVDADRAQRFIAPSVQASNNVKPVAVVRENLAGNEARVQYLFNPVPVGAELQWDHNDLASVLAEVEARDDAR